MLHTAQDLNEPLIPAVGTLQACPAYRGLQAHYNQIQGQHMKDWFRDNPNRQQEFSRQLEDLYVDFSKNRIQKDTLTLLMQLAEQRGLKAAIEDLKTGMPLNNTEGRSALHTVVRMPESAGFFRDGHNLLEARNATLWKMKALTETLHSGHRTGFTGKPITDVVNLGIGGSDLGPAMVCQALRPFKQNMNVHFVSNIDGTAIYECLSKLDPETTLFLVVSKSFHTQETMVNAASALYWMQEAGCDHPEEYCIGISANPDAMTAFGIPKEAQLEMWEEIGGRFSLWSAAGLSICLSLGWDHFEALLAGAHQVDEHFFHTPFLQNIPVLMGMIGIWYRNFFHCSSHAVCPYDQSLGMLPAYLQQLDMESNGKSVDKHGNRLSWASGSVIWGAAGTDAQHSFFQWLHQGVEMTPVDFIVPARSQHPLGGGGHHRLLLSNCLAQSRAFMTGRTQEEAAAMLRNAGHTTEQVRQLSPHKTYPGNRPSTTFLLKELTPYTLGMLLALYEHKVFVQGIIWGINSFDQWGVELGKQLADELERARSSADSSTLDPSTRALLRQIEEWTTASD